MSPQGMTILPIIIIIISSSSSSSSSSSTTTTTTTATCPSPVLQPQSQLCHVSLPRVTWKKKILLDLFILD